jgi:putative flippase GtrA
MIKIQINRQFVLHFLKYSFVGAFNAVFTFLFYFILLKVIRLHYLVSFSVSWLLGVLLTYIINFLWVFKPEQKLVFKSRLLKYFTVYITSYLLNMFLLKQLTELTRQDPLLVQLVIIPVVVAVNFAGIKYWCMNSKPVKRRENNSPGERRNI